eukprot:5010516-Pyramimonas_sp.AAC.1
MRGGPQRHRHSKGAGGASRETRRQGMARPRNCQTPNFAIFRAALISGALDPSPGPVLRRWCC